MAGKNTSVFGIFKDRIAAERAVDALKSSGFRNSDVSCLLPDNEGTKILVSVHCDNSEWVKRAKEILEIQDGKDVASRSEAAATVKGSATDRPYDHSQLSFGA